MLKFPFRETIIFEIIYSILIIDSILTIDDSRSVLKNVSLASSPSLFLVFLCLFSFAKRQVAGTKIRVRRVVARINAHEGGEIPVNNSETARGPTSEIING